MKGSRRPAGGSSAEAPSHASFIMNGLSLVQGHFPYILGHIVAHYSVNQMIPTCSVYLSELCGIRHFFMVFRMLHLRKLLKKTELYDPTEERDMGLHKKKWLIKKLPVGLFLKPPVNILRATRKIFKCTTEFFINKKFSYFGALEAFGLIATT